MKLDSIPSPSFGKLEKDFRERYSRYKRNQPGGSPNFVLVSAAKGDEKISPEKQRHNTLQVSGCCFI